LKWKVKDAPKLGLINVSSVTNAWKAVPEVQSKVQFSMN
jgi:hypothetical protein